ncbi:carbamoyl-phosphate synthase domain-containing protein [Escherichia coli]
MVILALTIFPDEESDAISCSRINYSRFAIGDDSNYRAQESLSDYLKRHNIVAIADIDTRKLTRLLREKGAQSGCIIAGDKLDDELALEKAVAFPG